jgi:hypothetical protein
MDNRNKILNNNTAFRIVGRYNPADKNQIADVNLQGNPVGRGVRSFEVSNDANVFTKGLSIASTAYPDKQRNYLLKTLMP